LRGAVEIFEDGEAALQQICSKRLGLAVRQAPEPWLPHVGDRILEQLRVVERQDAAAVLADVKVSQLTQDLAQVLLGTRVIVIPGGRPAPAKASVAAPAEAHKREAAIVVEVVAVGRSLRSRTRPFELSRGARGAHDCTRT